MTEWSIHFTLTHDPITIDQHFDALEALDRTTPLAP